jgi:hypothetical protein
MSEDNAPAEWLAELPEQLRNAPFIGKAENIDDAIGKLAHAAQYMGQAIKLPADDASEEDKAVFFEKLGKVPGYARIPGLDDIEGQAELLAKLGAPEDATGYALPDIENFEWDDNISVDLKKYAKEAGLTKAQFTKFASLIGGQEQQAGSATSTARDEQRNEVRTSWGEALSERENLIRGWLEKSEAPTDMVEGFNDKNLSLDTMNWLLSVAGQFKGTVTPIHEDGQGREPIMDPASARERIQEILKHPAYFDNANPLHKDMVNEMLKAQRLANAKQSA